MPAEYEPQEAVWLMIGGLYSHWHSGGFAIRDTQVKLAKAILEAGTKVNIAVPQNYIWKWNTFSKDSTFPFTR